jgi:signal transduction histidine kinase
MERAGCSVRTLTSKSRRRRCDPGLVTAIKGFTHGSGARGRTVDLKSSLGIGRGAQLKGSIEIRAVTVDVPPGLPRPRGFAGELNQIWANLIDNALDAVPIWAVSM